MNTLTELYEENGDYGVRLLDGINLSYKTPNELYAIYSALEHVEALLSELRSMETYYYGEYHER